MSSTDDQFGHERTDAFPVALALFAQVGGLRCPARERVKLERTALRIVTSIAEAVESQGKAVHQRPCEVARVACVRTIALLDGLKAMGAITRDEDFQTRTYVLALFGFLADLKEGVLTRAGAEGGPPS